METETGEIEQAGQCQLSLLGSFSAGSWEQIPRTVCKIFLVMVIISVNPFMVSVHYSDHCTVYITVITVQGPVLHNARCPRVQISPTRLSSGLTLPSAQHCPGQCTGLRRMTQDQFTYHHISLQIIWADIGNYVTTSQQGQWICKHWCMDTDLAWLVTVLVMRGHAVSRNTHTALVTWSELWNWEDIITGPKIKVRAAWVIVQGKYLNKTRTFTRFKILIKLFAHFLNNYSRSGLQ